MPEPDRPPSLTRRIRVCKDPEQLERWYLWAERVAKLAFLRIVLLGGMKAGAAAPPPTTWISPARAGQISSLSARWFYDHAHELPFVRKAGRRLLVSEEGLRRWLERR